jgi:hypothetical protein
MANISKALTGVLVNKAGEALGKIGDPRARDAVGRIVNGIFPGLAGGTENYSNRDYQDNIFIRDQIDSARELLKQTGQAGQIQVKDDGSDSTGTLGESYDWRARLRPKNGGASEIYALEDGLGLLAPLKRAGGLIWQTTPNIFLSGSAQYNESHMQGMNYPIHTYMNSSPPMLPIAADFYANDVQEGQYLLAVFQFLKRVTKGHFGDSAVAKGSFGTPPPVLIFEYLGDHGFNKVPVIVKDYIYSLPEDVDYVPVVSKSANGQKQTTYVPTRTNITINLAPSYTPHKLRKRFDIDGLARGTSYRDGFI